MNKFERNKDPKKSMKIGKSSKPVDVDEKFLEITMLSEIDEDITVYERKIVFFIQGKEFDSLDSDKYGFSLYGDLIHIPAEDPIKLTLWYAGGAYINNKIGIEISMNIEWDTNMNEAIKELRWRVRTAIYHKGTSNM